MIAPKYYYGEQLDCSKAFGKKISLLTIEDISVDSSGVTYHLEAKYNNREITFKATQKFLDTYCTRDPAVTNF
jgi:hypothetical protein